MFSQNNRSLACDVAMIKPSSISLDNRSRIFMEFAKLRFNNLQRACTATHSSKGEFTDLTTCAAFVTQMELLLIEIWKNVSLWSELVKVIWINYPDLFYAFPESPLDNCSGMSRNVIEFRERHKSVVRMTSRPINFMISSSQEDSRPIVRGKLPAPKIPKSQLERS